VGDELLDIVKIKLRGVQNDSPFILIYFRFYFNYFIAFFFKGLN